MVSWKSTAAHQEKATIRRATPDDADDFVALMSLSAPTLLPAVYGPNVSALLRSLFRHRGNLYSFEHSRFAVVEGRTAGLLLSYDSKTEKREELWTGVLLARYLNVRLLPQVSAIMSTQSALGHREEGYYTSNLAVYPEHQGHGVGTDLLTEAEAEARELGCGRAVLDVEEENENARRLYERLGYSAYGQPKTIAAGGKTHRLLRMHKPISMCAETAA